MAPGSAGTSPGIGLEQQQQQQHSTSGKGAINKNAITPQSPATRPEDLGVTPWYLEDSPSMDASPGPTSDRGSYPTYVYGEREANGKPDLNSTRNSSIESEMPRGPPGFVPRKAYMDLKDAIALLDETCPNQEPSPSLTPRTPRTPLTPYPRNKRARSKSSDNSSNYSNDRLSDRSFETTAPQEKEKKRPFLRKIGISKTEDRPFLAKLTPKIIGKPYLEKIGPSKAVEKPFLDKIGSSKTVDKFTFDAPRSDRAVMIDRSNVEGISELREDVQPVEEETETEKNEKESQIEEQMARRRRSGKGFLSKMYSFETEDLDEATVQTKERRDVLRGASLDDVLDSGPSSLPPIQSEEDQSLKPELEQRPTSAAELLKCRVTTSEEIISSSSCIGSPRELNSWASSPRRRRLSKRSTSKTPIHRKTTLDSRETLRSDESTPNSPTKRPISNVSPEYVSGSSTLERNPTFSPSKSRRQTLEDTLDRNGEGKENEKISKNFERRGISSDNLLSRDAFAYVASQPINSDRTREATSEDSLAIRRDGLEYSRETFKQLQDKFEMRETFTETYAAFKRRTKGSNLQISTMDRVKTTLSAQESQTESQKESSWKTKETSVSNSFAKAESKPETAIKQERTSTRSVLKKQEGIDHPSDHEADANGSLRRPKRRIFHEPSQETMDLLTELRKVKSLLKTPSWEKDYDFDKKPTRLPKRILLTDKEFCLSVERENSVRRPSRTINVLEKTEESSPLTEERNPDKSEEREESKTIERKISRSEDSRGNSKSGPALFEKNFLSLDYADDEKPTKPETLAISLGSMRNVASELEESKNYSDLGLICDSKSYSDAFDTPSEEMNEEEKRSSDELTNKINRNNHCADIDIAIPIDQRVGSPKGKVSIQSRTSDLYEIISPRSTPFRMKKRLGKISVEEAVKPENFTLGSKVDCRSVVQKRTKCFPL